MLHMSSAVHAAHACVHAAYVVSRMRARMRSIYAAGCVRSFGAVLGQ
jgi:hypothetical protein